MSPELNDFTHVMTSGVVTLHATEVMILLGVLTLCLLFRLNRLGMILVYLDVYRWGWMFFQDSYGKSYQNYLTGYFLFGGIVLLLFVIGIFSEPKT